MTSDADPSDDAAPSDARPECTDADCADAAAFRLYDAEAGAWRPVCARHLRHAHPSLEVRAWLESGLARPVEVGQPTGPPDGPSTGRAEAFRQLVEAAMGWTRGE